MLQLIINKILALDPALTRYLRPLQGKQIAIICTDFSTQYCTFTAEQILCSSSVPAQLDATISGTLADFLKFAITKQNRNLHISGDATIAQLFAKFYLEMHIDWEEELSKHTGDAIAYQTLHTLRKIKQYQHETTHSVAAMLTEYLQEESALVPTHYEVDAFMQNVDDLRLRVDRLEARIKAYESN